MSSWIIPILLLFGAAIALGVCRNINIGPITMVIALLIGCVFLGLKPSDILNHIPAKVLFYIVAVTLFYGFAQENGTMDNLAAHVIYAMGRVPMLMPAIIYLLTALIAYMGVGIFAGAFLAPLAFEAGRKERMNPLLIYVCVNCGAVVGSNMPQSLGGLVIQELIAQGPYSESAFVYTAAGSVFTAVVCTLMVALSHLLYRGSGSGQKEFCRPEAFTPIQRLNLMLIASVTLLSLAGSSLFGLLPAPWNNRLAALTDIGVLCSIGTLAAILLNLGNEREIISRRIPWGVVVMLAGVSALLGVATECGMIDALPEQLLALSPRAAAPLLAFLAGFMSIFTSGVTVVCPTLFPLVPVFASALNISPSILYASIFTGASVTSTSPFSTAGGTVLSCCKAFSQDSHQTYKILPIPLLLLLLTVAATVLWGMLL